MKPCATNDKERNTATIDGSSLKQATQVLDMSPGYLLLRARMPPLPSERCLPGLDVMHHNKSYIARMIVPSRSLATQKIPIANPRNSKQGPIFTKCLKSQTPLAQAFAKQATLSLIPAKPPRIPSQMATTKPPAKRAIHISWPRILGSLRMRRISRGSPRDSRRRRWGMRISGFKTWWAARLDKNAKS